MVEMVEKSGEKAAEGQAEERQCRELERLGITMLSDSRKPERPSNAANTYLFSTGGRQYVVDPGFGSGRAGEIQRLLDKNRGVDVLCTHYHNDHSANNGRIARRDSRIIYHHGVRDKIRYLRTNGTGQIVDMGRRLDLEGMLRRFRMFPDWLIALVRLSAKLSRKLPDLFLFLVSYAYSLKHIGRICPGRKQAVYLRPEDRKQLPLDRMNAEGWIVAEDLFALETPGHTDDHLVYYLAGKKSLFAGDALNFLNGNDIQFGDICRVDETVAFLKAFVAKEEVAVLFQGHFYPVTGTRNILDHIDGIQEKHRDIYHIARQVVVSMAGPFYFSEAYDRLCRHPAPLSRQLARRTFPRSTLVFLDVYLLKVLESLGCERLKDGRWTLAGRTGSAQVPAIGRAEK